VPRIFAAHISLYSRGIYRRTYCYVPHNDWIASIAFCPSTPAMQFHLVGALSVRAEATQILLNVCDYSQLNNYDCDNIFLRAPIGDKCG